MMQQFATSSSKLAVSSLSLDMNKAEAFSKEPNSSFDGSRSTFEKAIADAEQSAFVKASYFEKNKELYTQPVVRNPVIKNDVASSEAKIDANQLADSESVNAAGTPEERVKLEEPSESNAVLIDKKANTISTQMEETKSYVTSEQAKDAEDKIDAQATEAQIKLADENSAEFDYINFVTQIQTLNDDTVADTAPLITGISENEQSVDVSNISLTEEELQIILDAQQAGVDLQANLSDEQLTKLSDAIHKMLSQFHQQNGSSNAQSDKSEAIDTLDVKLMETMISQSANGESDDSQVGQIQGEIDTALSQSDKAAAEVYQNQSEIAEPLTAKDASLQSSTLQSSGEAKQTQADTAVDSGLATESELVPDKITEATTTPDISDDNDVAINAAVNAAATSGSEAKINAVQNKPVDEDASNVIKQMAMLDERSQTNIVENIKSRVEKFVADLSGNSAKGSEFVAAMQSGLKEFKEQMLSGREPGMDLKALISDAMSQANVDIPAPNQVKIDTALNQFSGLMNLANAVNQSTQAQAHQLFGTVETQMIKESNAMHAEGTKLAQQTPTNFDKAVNIFKPEGQQQLAEKVRWMIAGRNPAAEMRLDPAELGSMQVKINMTGDSASVSFTVQSAVAKEALDQALPKLRDMLQEQGIDLGQSSVEQQSNGQPEQQNEQKSSAHGTDAVRMADAQESVSPEVSGVIEQRIAGGSLGGIDYYA